MADEREIKEWITVKGKHIPIYEGEDMMDAIDRALKNNKEDGSDTKDTQIAKNKEEADRLNGKDGALPLSVTSALESAKYKGIWYGAKNNPISVRTMLDKIVKSNGSGFMIKTQQKATSDNLMDDVKTTRFLTDEEGRGKFKLDDNSIKYLLAKLPKDSYLYKTLSN